MAAYDQMQRSSLYVGDLHPQVTEKDLHDTFAPVGPLLSVHLCRDKFSGKSFCYAYVNFWLPCHAYTALQCLNHTLLRGKPMRIMWYEKNSVARNYGIGNLFVKNLDQSITSARLERAFSKYGTILSCKVVETNGISRGFGYVQFDSEDSAMQALRALHDTELQGKKIYVSKFQSKFERKRNIHHGLGSKNLTVGRTLNRDEYSNANYLLGSNNSNLIVKNLDPSVDDNKLAKLFSGYGKLISAKVIRDSGASAVFGFICFSCPDDAKKASNSLTGTYFEGRILLVEVARVYNKPYEQFSMLPHYTPVNQLPCCNFPGLCSPIRWSTGAFDLCDLFQAQSFNGNFLAWPTHVATSNECLKSSKITNERESCKEYGGLKTFYVRSSQEVYNIKPGYMPRTLFQTLQDTKPFVKLQEKFNNGDGKELRDISDTMETHCTESSPDIDKHLQPGNVDITPTSL